MGAKASSPRKLTTTLPQDVQRLFSRLNIAQQVNLLGLLGTAIGDAVGLPFELYMHAKNRRQYDDKQNNGDPSESFWRDVLPFLTQRLARAEGTPFGRSFSDDTVCTDLKMQALARATSSKGKVEEEPLFQAMLQEYLAWANNAGGHLFQGFGGFTKDLLKPSRGNRLGQLTALWIPDSGYHPTEEYINFAQEHFSGRYPGGKPSWGNGAVMSMTPQVLCELAGGGAAARVLSASHQEESAILAADLLSDVLRGIHSVKIKSSKDLAAAVVKPLKQLELRTEDSYVYPIAAFEEFLRTGDCKPDTANSFLHGLITRAGLAPCESDLVQSAGPFGCFGQLLRIASNFDDAERGPNVRLTVEGQPEVLVRFSQRGLNTVIIGIWCACSARKCVDWLRRVLYVGGDADTVGAVAGQIACPLLPLDDVVEAYKRAVALEEMTSKSAQVNQQAAKRFFQRSCLFVLADWPQLLQTPRLIDPAYEGFTTEDGMRVAGQCRTPCKFGGKCYEKKPNHRVQYSHPGDEDWQRLPCRYAQGCRDGSGGHQLEFSHPGDYDWEDLRAVTGRRNI